MAVDDEPAADGSPDESVLLRRCGRRDEDAFGVLYDRHADGVLRYLGRITGDVGAAEELAQETFFLMWEKAKRIKCVNGSVFPWLYTTAKYLAANHLRKKGNQHMLDIDRMDIGRVLAEVSTEEKVIAQDTLSRVHRAVSAMPEADQRIFFGTVDDFEEISRLNENILGDNPYNSKQNVDNFPTHRVTDAATGEVTEYAAASKYYPNVDPTIDDRRSLHYAGEDRTYLIFKNKYT